jgi:hypothetical protein
MNALNFNFDQSIKGLRIIPDVSIKTQKNELSTVKPGQMTLLYTGGNGKSL